MNWYKVKTDLTDGGYTYVGCSEKSLVELAEQAADGRFIRLDDLLYWDGKQVRSWVDWNATEVPSVAINPARIIAIQPFHDDPRKLEAIGQALEEQMNSPRDHEE